jgi:hypothetical protein
MKKRTTKLRKAFAAVGIEIVYVNVSSLILPLLLIYQPFKKKKQKKKN